MEFNDKVVIVAGAAKKEERWFYLHQLKLDHWKLKIE